MPGQIKPVHASPSTSWRSTLIFPAHLRLCLPNGLLPSGLSTETLYAHILSSIHDTCSLPPPTPLVRNTHHKAPRYVMSFTPLLPRPSYTRISSSAPYSRRPSVYVPPSMWETKLHTYTKQQTKLKLFISYTSYFWIESWKTKDPALNESKILIYS